MIVNRDRAVPIPADLDTGLSGDVAGSELHSVDGGQRFGQQRTLQRQRDVSLLAVQTSVLRRRVVRRVDVAGSAARSLQPDRR